MIPVALHLIVKERSALMTLSFEFWDSKTKHDFSLKNN